MEKVIAFFKKYGEGIFLTLFCLSIIALVFVWLIPNFSDLSTHFSERSQYKSGYGELFRVSLTTLAGLGALVALYISARRVQVMIKQTQKTAEQIDVMREQVEKTAEQIEIMYKGNVDTRFNDAVEHLGNENHSAVLGGIHVLHQIAVEHENYTQVVHNLFCSYLRENSAKLYEGIDFEKMPHKCPVIIQTLINYLFKPYYGEDSIYVNYASDLSYSKLKNCNFVGAILNTCDFDFADLNTCEFKNATLNNCGFKNTALSKCSFIFAKMDTCKFKNTTLSKCHFNAAILNACNFISARLNTCEFYSATLNTCGFQSTILDRCDFDSTYSEKCNFNSTALIDTKLPSNEINETQLQKFSI